MSENEGVIGLVMKQTLNRALVAHSKPAQPDEPSQKKRPTFRPKEGWMTYNINRQVDQSIILTSFTAMVDGLSNAKVWAHYKEGRRGTCPRLILKLLAVRFLFQLSAARALGIADLLRHALNIAPDTVFPSDGTLDYRLRSGAFTNLFEHLLALTVSHLEETTVAIDSTGFQDTRAGKPRRGTHMARSTRKAGAKPTLRLAQEATGSTPSAPPPENVATHLRPSHYSVPHEHEDHTCDASLATRPTQAAKS